MELNISRFLKLAGMVIDRTAGQENPPALPGEALHLQGLRRLVFAADDEDRNPVKLIEKSSLLSRLRIGDGVLSVKEILDAPLLRGKTRRFLDKVTTG